MCQQNGHDMVYLLLWNMKISTCITKGEKLYFPRSSFGTRKKLATEDLPNRDQYRYLGDVWHSADLLMARSPGQGRYVGVDDPVDRGRLVMSEGARAPKVETSARWFLVVYHVHSTLNPLNDIAHRMQGWVCCQNTPYLPPRPAPDGQSGGLSTAQTSWGPRRRATLTLSLIMTRAT